MDFSRLRTGETVAGIGGAALFLFLFFDWFSGGAEVTGSVTSGTVSVERVGISGWDAIAGDFSGFLIFAAGLSGLALAGLAAAGQRVNIPIRRGGVTAMLGTLATLLIVWSMLAGSPTLKIGVFLALGAVIAIAVGAVMALREDGIEPLLKVAGGRTRAASASAPAVAPPPPDKTPSRRASSSGGRSTTPRKRTTTRKAATRRKSTSGGKRGGARKSSSRSRSSSGTRRRSAKK